MQDAAFAIIEVNDRFLLQWNKKWGVLNFVGGKVEPPGNFATTIIREIDEELGVPPSEVQLLSNPQHIFMTQFSRHERKEKAYHFCVFPIQIFPTLPISTNCMYAQWLSTGCDNMFVSMQEIERLKTTNGCPISPTTKRILLETGYLTVAH